MENKKQIKNFNDYQKMNVSGVRNIKTNEQLENIDEKERLEYEEGIKLYKQGIENIEKAIALFENLPWGVPEELDRLFGERQGNETLWNLKKEINNLKEDMDLY